MRLGLQLIFVLIPIHESLGMRLGLQLIFVFISIHESLGMRLGLQLILIQSLGQRFWGKLFYFLFAEFLASLVYS